MPFTEAAEIVFSQRSMLSWGGACSKALQERHLYAAIVIFRGVKLTHADVPFRLAALTEEEAAVEAAAMAAAARLSERRRQAEALRMEHETELRRRVAFITGSNCVVETQIQVTHLEGLELQSLAP